jgi:hypothetical protein
MLHKDAGATQAVSIAKTSTQQVATPTDMRLPNRQAFLIGHQCASTCLTCLRSPCRVTAAAHSSNIQAGIVLQPVSFNSAAAHATASCNAWDVCTAKQLQVARKAALPAHSHSTPKKVITVKIRPARPCRSHKHASPTDLPHPTSSVNQAECIAQPARAVCSISLSNCSSHHDEGRAAIGSSRE